MIVDVAPGICGGEQSLAAFLLFMGVESPEELEQEQLRLFPGRSTEEPNERPSPDRLRGRRAA